MEIPLSITIKFMGQFYINNSRCKSSIQPFPMDEWNECRGYLFSTVATREGRVVLGKEDLEQRGKLQLSL